MTSNSKSALNFALNDVYLYMIHFGFAWVAIREVFWDGSKRHRRMSCHMIAYACDFEMALSSNHSVSLQFQLDILITCQNSEMAQNSNHFCLEFNFSSKLNGSNFEPSQNHMHIPSCDMTSFDVFLSHLKIPPVHIQRYPTPST